MSGQRAQSMDAKGFWERVEKSPEPDGCWEFNGSSGRGYGRLRFFTGVRGNDAWGGSARIAAHVLAWNLTNGPVPAGKILRHRCDNRRCCRPDHLLPGTKSENTRDYMDRPRQRPLGVYHGVTKMTWGDVEILRLLAYRMKQRRPDRKRGVAGLLAASYLGRPGKYVASHVAKVVRGDAWGRSSRLLSGQTAHG